MTELPEVTVKRYRASRSLRLRVLENGQVVVTAHPYVPAKQIDRFVAEHQDWIAEQLLKIKGRQKQLISSRGALPFRGKDYAYRLAITQTESKVEIKDKTVTVFASTEDDVVVRPILEKWYKQQAKKYFSERVPLLADLVNRDVVRVTVRSQRSRWGSCSSRNTISLNWRLILTPDWVSDYVIYHELAHLTHMNHSKAFWSLVQDYVPQYKKAEKWLKENHQLLFF